MVKAVAEEQYQSLYRRYRPQKFSEVLGQDHVLLALRNAARDAKVGHAYLFSGPRGTGKTSVARILAKALNCENPVDGEPDGTCDSCVRIQQGTSLDVHELDAASNNGVDAMRDLVSRAALGTPGRWKVYIVDEVHMLSTAASNALLKTLEEPPAHVVFVLATTDPQKVLPTIRSRTQHFEFRLLSPELLGKLVDQINADANLHVPAEALDLVVRRGKGSARDTLSVLDQVAVAGVINDEHEIIDEITEALCERDTGRALIAIAEAINLGRDPQRIAVDLLEYLRNGFLALMAKSLVTLPDNATQHVEEQARRLGAPALVRALEGIGEALLDMREAPEPRATLEVAIVRLTKPELGTDPASLLERIERLERNGGGSRSGAAPVAPAASASTVPSAPEQQTHQPSGPRPALGALRRTQQPPQTTTQTVVTEKADVKAPETPATGDVAPGQFPTRDQLVESWGDVLLDKMPQRAKARFRMGRFVAVEHGKAVFALPNAIHRDRCEEVRNEVEPVLRSHFGVRIPLQLIIDEGGSALEETASTEPEHEEIIDLNETTLSTDAEVTSPSERLRQAFPGAEEMQ
jgi:DNA polymerase III subunit gamma/tau